MAIGFNKETGIGFAVGGPIGAGVGGTFFGKKKSPKIDITQQLAAVRQNAATGRGLVQGQFNELQPLTGKYETDTAAALEAARNRAQGERSQFLGDTSKLADQAKEALRQNLYSKTFAGLPDTLRAVREASAAGSGIDSGAYQKAVGDVGVNTARALTEGERDIQIQGLQGQQAAQAQAYNVFSNLSSKLDDQKLEVLTKALDTRRTDVIQRTAQQLGLNDQETQAVIDLLNFQQSGQFASASADEAQKAALLNSLINAGGQLAGRGLK